MSLARARDEDPEATRADSPLLGAPGLAIDSGVTVSPVGILGTIKDDEESGFDIHRPTRVGRSSLNTFADVDKVGIQLLGVLYMYSDYFFVFS